MIKRKIRILFSPTIAVAVVLGALLCWGGFILFITSQPLAFKTHTFMAIYYTFMFIILPIIMLVLTVKKLFAVITIDETGISRSFLGKFYKLHMSWDEIAEIRYYIAICPFLVFSKTKNLTQIPSNKWHKIKDTVFLSIGKRRYAVIAQYLQQPIVNMPEAAKDYFSGKKKNKRKRKNKIDK